MKKSLLTITIITLSVVSLCVAQDSELQGAYDYAYDIGITTQQSLQAANMTGSLIRSHMAKMMVKYATNVLGKTPDYGVSCTFSDIADQNSELKAYIIQACQLGLMGQGISNFKPSDIVTRAQFGTVLSRALYDDIYNDGTPYYLFHLQALKEAGIMTNISSPTNAELRGYVMLMMMRASEMVDTSAVTPSVCSNLDTQLLCLIESSNCPIECQIQNDTNTGTLTISSVTINPGTVPAGKKYVGSIKFTATESDIALKTLTLQKIGAFVKGSIENDGVKIGNIQTLSTDTSILVTFSPNVNIFKGTSKILDIFIESDNTENQGVSVSTKQNITCSANSISGTFPIRLVN